MSEIEDDFDDLRYNGKTWTYEYLESNGRHYWYRAMSDEEVREHSRGLFDGLDDVDVQMASPPDYPIYQIELYPLGESGFEITAHKTNLEGSSPVMRHQIRDMYTEVGESKTAIKTVHDWARELS